MLIADLFIIYYNLFKQEVGGLVAIVCKKRIVLACLSVVETIVTIVETIEYMLPDFPTKEIETWAEGFMKECKTQGEPTTKELMGVLQNIENLFTEKPGVEKTRPVEKPAEEKTCGICKSYLIKSSICSSTGTRKLPERKACKEYKRDSKKVKRSAEKSAKEPSAETCGDCIFGKESTTCKLFTVIIQPSDKACNNFMPKQSS